MPYPNDASPFVRSRTLPTEVLARIFSHPDLVQPRKQMSLQTSQPPWTLTYVCRRWRLIALNLPEIWSYIDVRGYGHFHASVRALSSNDERVLHLHGLLRTLVARSQDHPLTIRLGCTGWFDMTSLETHMHYSEELPMIFVNDFLQAQFLSRLLMHHARWEDVLINGFPGCGLLFCSHLGSPGISTVKFPALKKLEVRPQSGSAHDRLDELKHMLARFQSNDITPNLQNVTLRLIFAAREDPQSLLNFAWRKVATLQLHDVADDKQLLELFGSSQGPRSSLESLHVSFVDFNRSRRPYGGFRLDERVLLGTLTSLSIIVVDDDHRLLLHSLQLPSLQHLSFRCKGINKDGSDAVSALELTVRGSPHLTSLQLHFSMQSFPSTWTSYERLLYSLNHLTSFDCGYISAETLVRLGAVLMKQTSEGNHAPLVLPRLASLQFYYEDCTAARKYIAKSRAGGIMEDAYHPGGLLLEIAEYRSGFGVGAGVGAGGESGFCLREIRVGLCMSGDPCMGAVGHLARYDALERRGFDLRKVEYSHKSCW